MRKLFTAMCVGALSLSAFAANPAFTTTPAQGEINMDANPSGIAGFDINFSETARCNRDAMGFITLQRDGEYIAYIPASQAIQWEFIEGFTKLGDGPGTTCNISFFSTAQTSAPAMMAANYQVVIPEAFFLFGDDEENLRPNEAITLNWSIAESADTGITISPANGATVESLNTITINYPLGTVITNVQNDPVERKVTDEDTGSVDIFIDYPISLEGNGIRYLPSWTINENVLTLNFQDCKDASGNTVTPTEMGDYKFELTANAVTCTLNGAPNNVGINTKYTIRDRSWNPTISPAEGSVDSFPLAFETGNSAMPKANFMITFPDDGINWMALMQKPYIVPAGNDGSFDANDAAKITLVYKKTSSAKEAYFGAQLYVNGEKTLVNLTLAPGHYAFVIPAKAFYGGGKQSPELVYYFDVTDKGIADLVITPAANSEDTAVKDVTITFPEGSTIYYDSTYRSYGAKLVNEAGNCTFPMAAELDAEKSNVITFTTPHYINVPGTWTFHTPTNGFFVDDTMYVFSVPFKVKDSGELTWEVSPKDKAEVASLDEVTITFNDPAIVSSVYYSAILSNEDMAQALNLVQIEDGVATLKCAETVEVEGEFTLDITEGSFVRGYLGNVPAMSFTYTVKPAAEPQPQNPDVELPDEVTEPLSEILISWADFVKVAIANFQGQLVPATRAEAIELTAEVVEGAEVPTVVLKPVAEVPDGDYDLVVEAGSFVLTTQSGEEVDSEAISQSFKVTTAVDAIVGEAAIVDVYSIDGVCLLRSVDAAAVKALPAGLYIVNGQKVIVK